MSIDKSDGGDGITFEHGSHGRVRAIVMRHGQRVTSCWRKNKHAALRNLVVGLTRRLSMQESTDYDWDTGEIFVPDDSIRSTVADGLEAMAMVQFAHSGNGAELFHLNGKDHIVNKIDRLFRGAHTLRWVQKREDAR